jgi:hypothetical protein
VLRQQLQRKPMSDCSAQTSKEVQEKYTPEALRIALQQFSSSYSTTK